MKNIESIGKIINKVFSRLIRQSFLFSVIFFLLYSIFLIYHRSNSLNQKVEEKLSEYSGLFVAGVITRDKDFDFKENLSELSRILNVDVTYEKELGSKSHNVAVPLNFVGKQFGYLVGNYNYISLLSVVDYIPYIIFIIFYFFFTISASASMRKFLEIKFKVPIYELINNIKNFNFSKNSQEFKNIKDTNVQEVIYLSACFTNLSQRIREYIREIDDYKSQIYQEKSKSALSNIALMLAHDLKKPFSKINLLLDEIEQKFPDNQGYKNEKLLFKKDLQVIDGLLFDLINLGTKKNLKLESVSIKSLIETSINIVSSNYNNPQIEISYDFHHTNLIFVDPNKIIRALINIIDNAYQALKLNGKLWFVSKEVKEGDNVFLELTIGNDGPSISEQKIRDIFSFSFTDGKTKGLGIGLASVKRVIEDHAGKVWCTSSDNKGTEFHLLLPLSNKKDNFISDSPGNNEKVKAQDGVLDFTLLLKGKINIISIDDDSFYTKQIKKYCDRLNLKYFGFETRQELYGSLSSIKPDVAFLDLTIDSETYCGYEVARRVLKLYPKCYVVIYSNHPAEIEEKRALSSGASRYIEKNMNYELFCKISCEACELIENTSKDKMLK